MPCSLVPDCSRHPLLTPYLLLQDHCLHPCRAFDLQPACCCAPALPGHIVQAGLPSPNPHAISSSPPPSPEQTSKPSRPSSYHFSIHTVCARCHPVGCRRPSHAHAGIAGPRLANQTAQTASRTHSTALPFSCRGSPCSSAGRRRAQGGPPAPWACPAAPAPYDPLTNVLHQCTAHPTAFVCTHVACPLERFPCNPAPTSRPAGMRRRQPPLRRRLAVCLAPCCMTAV